MGHMFLILIDAHSNWIEASIVNLTSSKTTIKKLEEIFAIHDYHSSWFQIMRPDLSVQTSSNSLKPMVYDTLLLHHTIHLLMD